MFENFVILLIFLNSIVLAIYDYNDRENTLEYNQLLELFGRSFTVLFGIEMILKILAQGFIIHKNAYLRDWWNWLDFIVVVTGFMEILEFSWFKVRALRTLRVLRPLRSIKAFPKMRQLVSSLVGSVNSLLNAVVFMFFIFMLFGILGIQQFQGTMYSRCRFTEEPVSSKSWPFDEDLEFVCSPDGQGLMSCPSDRFCKQPADANMPASIDKPSGQELIFYNMIGFDNLGWAMLTIFQMITLEQWTTVMYLLMDSNIWWMAVLFCVTLVLIGSFFLLNVILAILAESLNMSDMHLKQENARLAKIRMSLQRAARQQQRQNQGQQLERLEPNNQENSVMELLEHHRGEGGDQDYQKDKSKNETVDHSKIYNLHTELRNQTDVDMMISQNCADIQRQDYRSQIEILSDQDSKIQLNLDHKRDSQDSKIGASQQNNDQKFAFPLQRQSQITVGKYLADEAEPVGRLFDDMLESQLPDQNAQSNVADFNESHHLNQSTVIQMPEHAKKNRFYQICFRICTHWIFTFTIIVLIIANTIILSLDKFPEDLETTKTVDVLNQVFTWCFVVEMIIKLIGLGFRQYARDSFNLFDAFIVAISLVDLIITVSISNDSSETPTGALSAFRGLRLLRIFKLARSWTSFREILAKILKTLKHVSTFVVLLLIFMFIFSLLGMELFGYKVQFYQDSIVSIGQKDFDKSVSPRPNFNDLVMGFTSIFAVAVGDDWNYLMALAYRAEGFIAIMFYPTVFIMMNLILFNLFLAILLQDFDQTTEPNEEKGEEKSSFKLGKRFKKFFSPCQKFWTKISTFCAVKEEQNDQKDENSSLEIIQKNDSENKENIIMQHLSQSSEISEEGEPFPSINDDNRKEITMVTAVNESDLVQPENNKDMSMLSSTSLQRTQIRSKQVRSVHIEQKDRQKTVRQALLMIPEEYRSKNLKKQLKSQLNDESEMKRVQELAESQALLLNTGKLMSLASIKQMELIQKHGSIRKQIKMIGKSLFIFSKENICRKICYHIVKHKWYDRFVLFLIAISTILLAIDNPNMDQNGKLAKVLVAFDHVLTTLFTIECLINLILFGLICNGKSSYARDPWNVIDLLIVIFSLITLVYQDSVDDLSTIKVFRMLRVLRPLRFLKRNFGLKIQVVSLMKAIPGIANLLLISILILMIFGIQSIGLLKGTFFYCETENLPDYAEDRIMTKWDCLDYGGDWVNQADNFDDVVTAMMTLFGMMSTEGWLEVMWNAVDSTNIYQVPRRNNKLVLIIFFTLLMVVGSLFLMNLFVGVVINTFNIEKMKLSRNNLLTELQNEYVEVLIKCYTLRPIKTVIKSGNKFRDQMLRIAQHTAFEVFIFVCICSNTFVLAMSWYGMAQEIIDVLEILNYIFTVIYTVEMVVKMIAFGKGYFKDSWCLFDFIIVLSAWVGIILLKVFDIDVGSISTIIRSFRIARVLKLIKTAKRLQQIFQTFILAIPELVNVGGLLMLFLFLFAVLGVTLFAEIKQQDNMDRHANFENFGRAVLTLLRVATGEGWVGIMHDAARTRSILFQCDVEDQTYESKVKDGIQGCGNAAAYVFFVAFILIVSLVFLNLFIAIILEGFAEISQEEKIRVDDKCLEAFQRAWRRYDPQATEMIEVQNLEDLIMDLIVEEVEIISKGGQSSKGVNFNLHRFNILLAYTKWHRKILSDKDRSKGFFKDIKINKRKEKGLRRSMNFFISNLQLPLYDRMQKVQFHDTLNGIIGSVFKKMHKKTVEERNQRIETKNKVGEQLVGWEGITVGSEKFWELNPRQQEELLQLTEEDFQKTVNRLENKGNEVDQAILKLSYMRRLRKKSGLRFTNQLFVFEDKDEQQRVIDSGHFVGARRIQTFMIKQRKRKTRTKHTLKSKQPAQDGYMSGISLQIPVPVNDQCSDMYTEKSLSQEKQIRVDDCKAIKNFEKKSNILTELEEPSQTITAHANFNIGLGADSIDSNILRTGGRDKYIKFSQSLQQDAMPVAKGRKLRIDWMSPKQVQRQCQELQMTPPDSINSVEKTPCSSESQKNVQSINNFNAGESIHKIHSSPAKTQNSFIQPVKNQNMVWFTGPVIQQPEKQESQTKEEYEVACSLNQELSHLQHHRNFKPLKLKQVETLRHGTAVTQQNFYSNPQHQQDSICSNRQQVLSARPQNSQERYGSRQQFISKSTERSNILRARGSADKGTQADLFEHNKEMKNQRLKMKSLKEDSRFFYQRRYLPSSNLLGKDRSKRQRIKHKTKLRNQSADTMAISSIGSMKLWENPLRPMNNPFPQFSYRENPQTSNETMMKDDLYGVQENRQALSKALRFDCQADKILQRQPIHMTSVKELQKQLAKNAMEQAEKFFSKEKVVQKPHQQPNHSSRKERSVPSKLSAMTRSQLACYNHNQQRSMERSSKPRTLKLSKNMLLDSYNLF